MQFKHFIIPLLKIKKSKRKYIINQSSINQQHINRKLIKTCCLNTCRELNLNNK